MQVRPFEARLLYTVGRFPAGSVVELQPGEWKLDGFEYGVSGTELRLREHEFERVRRPRPDRVSFAGTVLDTLPPPRELRPRE